MNDNFQQLIDKRAEEAKNKLLDDLNEILDDWETRSGDLLDEYSTKIEAYLRNYQEAINHIRNTYNSDIKKTLDSFQDLESRISRFDIDRRFSEISALAKSNKSDAEVFKKKTNQNFKYTLIFLGIIGLLLLADVLIDLHSVRPFF